MYYGVPNVGIATSENLADWTPIEVDDGRPLAVLSPRPGYFDSWLVEPGPPAILTDRGIVLLYNAGNSDRFGERGLPARMYTAGQALFDARNPIKLLDRTAGPFLRPTEAYERTGQYPEGRRSSKPRSLQGPMVPLLRQRGLESRSSRGAR
jgi:predicted GH43/DUF377 family glycosyl hydrolase